MRASMIAGLFVVALLALGLRLHSQNVTPRIAAAPVEAKGTGKQVVVRIAPGAAPVWKAEVTGESRTTSSAARQSALETAAGRLSEYMRERYPGYRWNPTPAFLQEHRMADEGREESQTLDVEGAPVMLRHTLTVEMRESDLKALLEEDRRERGIERLKLAGRGLGGLLVMLLALIGYFRLDDWTKGYLSLPLKLSALAVAVAGPAVLWWMI